MSLSIYLAIVPLLGLLVQVVSHATLIHVFSQKTPWKLLLISFLIGLFFTTIFSVVLMFQQQFSFLDIAGTLCVNIGAMIALGFGYFTFVNLNYTSLRFRLLREFISQNGKLSHSEILKKYNSEVILSTRINRLVRAGELIYDNPYYRLGATKFSLMSLILNWFKRVLLKSHPV